MCGCVDAQTLSVSKLNGSICVCGWQTADASLNVLCVIACVFVFVCITLYCLCVSVCAVWGPVVWGGGRAMCGPLPEGASVLQQPRWWEQESGLCYALPHHEIQLQQRQCKCTHTHIHTQTQTSSKDNTVNIFVRGVQTQKHRLTVSKIRWVKYIQRCATHLQNNVLIFYIKACRWYCIYDNLRAHGRHTQLVLSTSLFCLALMSSLCLFWAHCTKFLLKDVSLGGDSKDICHCLSWILFNWWQPDLCVCVSLHMCGCVSACALWAGKRKEC